MHKVSEDWTVLFILGTFWLGISCADSSADETYPVELRLINESEISARDAGVLSRVAVAESHRVKSGDLLAQLDDEESQLLVERARLEADIARRKADDNFAVQSAEKGAAVARTDFQRAKASKNALDSSVSQSELDQLELKADQAELEAKRVRHEWETARLSLELKQNELRLAEQKHSRRRINSPLAGMVVQLYRHEGEWVEPGTAIARVIRLDRLRAEGYVNSRHIPPDAVGSPARLALDSPGQAGQEFLGTLVFVSPEVDPIDGKTKIHAEFENRDNLLRPGLHGTLRIDVRSAPSRKVPK